MQVVHTEFIKVSLTYRVFNLQVFKQNDSRTSCSSSDYCANFQKKQVTEKEKKKGEVSVQPWLKRIKNLEFYETLHAELRLEDNYNYDIILRITSENFEKLFYLIKDDRTKENSKLREQIPPKL